MLLQVVRGIVARQEMTWQGGETRAISPHFPEKLTKRYRALSQVPAAAILAVAASSAPGPWGTPSALRPASIEASVPIIEWPDT